MTISLAELRAGDYDTVIVVAPDMNGRLVGKRLAPRKLDAFADQGIGMSACTFGWDIQQDVGLEVPYVGFHTGWRDFLLVPDLATLRPAAWLERTAVVMADIVEEHDRSPVEITPRRILQRQVEALAGDGLVADAATELEFHLYRESYDDLRTRGYADRTPTTRIHADYTVQQVNQWEPFFQQLRRDLDASGLDVELSQGEWGLGQWEINLAYGDALGMADRHVLFKLAVKDAAHRAGLSATFMPKPVTGGVGSSCHVHLSLRRPGEQGEAAFPMWSPTAEHHLSPVMHHAIGGILRHAPDLMAWNAPTVNAYRRTNAQEFAGHGATWGLDNRTVSARVLGTGPSSLRVEWRVPGADANPYLVLAGMLASVRDGLATAADPGPMRSGDAYREHVDPFPRSLGEAAERFRSSAFIASTFGPDVVDQYAAAAAWEWHCFEQAVTDWELHRYYENI